MLPNAGNAPHLPTNDDIEVESYFVSEVGWVRRNDQGANVWEKPDGTLYKHFNGGEPELQRLRRLL